MYILERKNLIKHSAEQAKKRKTTYPNTVEETNNYAKSRNS